MSGDTKNKHPKFPADGTFFGISEGNLLSLMTLDIDKQHIMRKNLNTPLLRASSTGANYRFINYLDSVGLLRDTDDERGAGWRKISFLKLVYILVVIELRAYGLKTEELKKFSGLFLDGEDNSVAYCSVMMVLGGVEMTIVVHNNGDVAILDPMHTGLYESEKGYGMVPRRGKGEIQLKLSPFVNEALENIGKSPVTIRHWFGKKQNDEMLKGSLSNAELTAVSEMRNLDYADTLKIRQMKDKRTMIDVERAIPRDDELAKQLASIVDEYGELTIATEGGKVVNLKKSQKTIIKD